MKQIYIFTLLIGVLMFAMNFMNYESRIIIFLGILVIMMYGKLPNISFLSACLFLFSFTMYIFLLFHKVNNLTYYILPILLSPIISHYVGYLFTSSSTSHRYTYALVIAMILGRFIHGFLNLLINDFVVLDGRNGYDIWTSSPIAATLQSTFFIMVIGASPGILFFEKFKKFNILIKLSMIFLLLLSLYNAYISATRTPILIFVSLNIVVGLILLKTRFKKVVKSIMLIGISVIIVVFAFPNFSGQLVNSQLFGRLFGNVDSLYVDVSRLDMIVSTLKQSVVLPWGDGLTESSHSLWFDVLKQVGWIPFLFLLVYSALSAAVFYRLWVNKNIKFNLKLLIVCLAITLLVQFSVEPILKAVPYLFSLYCVIVGIASGLLKVASNRV